MYVCIYVYICVYPTVCSLPVQHTYMEVPGTAIGLLGGHSTRFSKTMLAQSLRVQLLELESDTQH